MFDSDDITMFDHVYSYVPKGSTLPMDRQQTLRIKSYKSSIPQIITALTEHNTVVYLNPVSIRLIRYCAEVLIHWDKCTSVNGSGTSVEGTSGSGTSVEGTGVSKNKGSAIGPLYLVGVVGRQPQTWTGDDRIIIAQFLQILLDNWAKLVDPVNPVGKLERMVYLKGAL
jgi:hypothetical protein